MKFIKRLLKLVAAAGVGYGAFVLIGKIREMKSTFQSVVTFKGAKERIEENCDYTGGSYGVLMGAYSLDLSDAMIKDDVVIMELKAICSAVSIKVPTVCQVKREGTNMNSNVHCKSSIIANEDQQEGPVIIIRYQAILSSISIHKNEDQEDQDNLDI